MKFKFVKLECCGEDWWCLDTRPGVKLCHNGMVKLFPQVETAGAIEIELNKKSVKGSFRMTAHFHAMAATIHGKWTDLTVNTTRWLEHILGIYRFNAWYVKVTPI